jgi:hypothetical protein
MKVQNMTSNRTGKEVANQFEIVADNGDVFFQSYRTVIAKISGGKITLDHNSWDYSMTTGKYRNQFLGENKATTEAKIKSGEYTLADLNS